MVPTPTGAVKPTRNSRRSPDPVGAFRHVRLPGVAIAVVPTVGAAWACGARRRPAPARHSLDFARDVQPILAASCVRCHGPRKTEGDLRLDTPEGLRKGGSSGPVVLHGDGKGSLLYQLLVETDPEKRMPRRRRPLTAAQIETVRQWIDQGAPWPSGLVVTAASPSPPPAAAARRRRSGFGRSARLLQQRRAPHPGRQLLRLPRPRSQPAADGPASRPGGGRDGAPPLGRGGDRARPPRDERAHPARHGSGREAAHAPRLERQAAPERGPDRHPPPLDRAGRALGAALVVHPAHSARAAGGAGRRLAPQPGRRVRARRHREGGPRALAGGRAARAAAPAELRPDRPAADAGGGARVPRRHRPRRLRAPGRPAARLAALRRAHGRALARPRALRRQRRLSQRQRRARSGPTATT